MTLFDLLSVYTNIGGNLIINSKESKPIVKENVYKIFTSSSELLRYDVLTFDVKKEDLIVWINRTSETQRFYFTYGSNPIFPFCGGYVIVKAGSLKEAIEKYRKEYPDVHDNLINCAFYYSESEWQKIEVPMGECHRILE